MVVLGWIVLGSLVAGFLFIPPALIGRNYVRELMMWLSVWVFAAVVTALVLFGVYAVTGNFG